MMTASTLPQTMRAWQYSSNKGGIIPNLRINSSAALPQPKANEHLVKVIAAALNPIDYKPATNSIIYRLAIPKPATPGIDFAGRIVRPAEGSDLKAGQLIFGLSNGSPLCGGALREYITATAEGTIALPDSIDPIDAATVGVAGLTAYQTIIPKVQTGKNVFINGGSGGVGLFGIQIAKAHGCHVTATCSTRNMELCKNVGADTVIDYTKHNVVEDLKANKEKYDLVVDNAMSDPGLYWRGHEYMNPDARYIVVAGAVTLNFAWTMTKMRIWPSILGGGKRKIEGFFTAAKVQDLEAIRTWMVEKKVKAVIDSKFAFEDAPKALEKLKTMRARGKIVVEVDPSA